MNLFRHAAGSALVFLLLTFGGVGASAAVLDVQMRPTVPVLMSNNMDYVAYIPLDVPSVSGALREVDGHRLYYNWGMKGLSIYDVDQPDLPTLVGHLPLPASQNEDMQVSSDGSRTIIAADGGSSTPVPINQGIHVLDTSDPAAPEEVAYLTPASNHTVACADDACEWLYGSTTGSIYHAPLNLTSAGDITVEGNWLATAREGGSVTGVHAMNRTTNADGTQLMITDTNPRLVMDVTDPAQPVVLARGSKSDIQVADPQLQHNNRRPDAELWEPRPADDPGPTYTEASGFQQIDGQLRPGELMIAGSELNNQTTCPTNPGKVTTWSIANYDRGAAPRPLAQLKLQSGTFENGNPPANVQGCSSHWFDWIHDPAPGAAPNSYLIAAGWYEHGVRVISVDPYDYSLKIVGYANLAMGSASAAYWIPDAKGSSSGAWYIYVPDYRRGLHILRYNP